MTDSDALLLAAALGKIRGDLAEWFDPLADAIEGKTIRTVEGPDGTIAFYTAVSELIDNDEAAARQRETIQS